MWAAAKNENDVAAKLDEKSLDELLAELDALIGLQNVKKHIHDQITLINFNKLRKEQGVEDASGFSLHSVAVGKSRARKNDRDAFVGKNLSQTGLAFKRSAYSK